MFSLQRESIFYGAWETKFDRVYTVDIHVTLETGSCLKNSNKKISNVPSRSKLVILGSIDYTNKTTNSVKHEEHSSGFQNGSTWPETVSFIPRALTSLFDSEEKLYLQLVDKCRHFLLCKTWMCDSAEFLLNATQRHRQMARANSCVIQSLLRRPGWKLTKPFSWFTVEQILVQFFVR